MSCSSIISGIGSYVPDRVRTNDDLAQRVQTSEDWIRSRTGIQRRCVADEDQPCSFLAVRAARAAIADAGLQLCSIDMVIVATMTPDMLFPATACLVQAELGLPQVPCFDVGAACSGFLYVLELGHALLQSGHYAHVLLIGAEKLSSVLDWHDRTTCVLFGDAAGAVVLSRSEQPGVGLIACSNAADGRFAQLLHMPAGGSAMPASSLSVHSGAHFLKMQGREVFKAAVRLMEQSVRTILREQGLSSDKLHCVIPHQANLRIIETLADRLRIPLSKFFINLDRYGNTSAASIPLALAEARNSGRFATGDIVLLLAFGAGFTWGASLILWQ